VTQPEDDDESITSASSAAEDDTIATPDSIDTHLRNLAGDDDEMDMFDSIVGHRWDGTALQLEVAWKTEEKSWEDWKNVREDYPYETAIYLRDHKVGSANGTYSGGPHQRWSRSFLRKSRRVLRRFIRQQGYQQPLYDSHVIIYPTEPDPSKPRYFKQVRGTVP